jgi:hypothetical protein
MSWGLKAVGASAVLLVLFNRLVLIKEGTHNHLVRELYWIT